MVEEDLRGWWSRIGSILTKIEQKPPKMLEFPFGFLKDKGSADVLARSFEKYFLKKFAKKLLKVPPKSEICGFLPRLLTSSAEIIGFNLWEPFYFVNTDFLIHYLSIRKERISRLKELMEVLEKPGRILDHHPLK